MPPATAVDTAPTTGEDASTVEQGPVGRPGSLRFIRVDDPSLEPEQRGGRFTTLDGLDGLGFVIGGYEFAADGAAHPVVWRSLDGASWARDELPLAAAGATLTTSVRIGDRLVFFGAETLTDRALAWAIGGAAGIEAITPPRHDGRWSVVGAEPFGDGAIVWGRVASVAAGEPAVFAVTSADGSTWRQARAVNQLLDGNEATDVIDVASGPSGTAAVLSTKSGDFLVLVHDGTSWAAWVLDDGSAEIAGLEVSDTVRLAGATIRGGVARPALFVLDGSGEWVARRVDVVPDDRNAGFQSASGDRLRDAFLGGRVITGNVATAEVIAVRAGAGTWIEAAYPDAVSGQGQPPIAEVVQSGTTTLAIARDRPAVVRLDGFAVTPVTSEFFPEGASIPSAAGPVSIGDAVVFAGAYASVPAGTGAPRRTWATWKFGGRGRVAVKRAADERQLELADLEVGRDGSLLGVGFESFVPANFANFIQPYEWIDTGDGFQPRPIGGDDRTLRFHQVADTGGAVVAVGAVFDGRGRLDPVFFRRGIDGVWVLAPAPEQDEAERGSSVSLIEMCPLPLAGAVLFASYADEGAQNRTYVTGDGSSWQHFAPPELTGDRAIVNGCAAGAEAVIVFGTFDGRPQLWRTVDGQVFETIPTPASSGIADVAVDDAERIWLLTTRRRVIELAEDGTRRSTAVVPAGELVAPAGPAEVDELAVTPRRVVLLGSWNGGIGLWSADRARSATTWVE